MASSTYLITFPDGTSEQVPGVGNATLDQATLRLYPDPRAGGLIVGYSIANIRKWTVIHGE